MSEVWWKDPWIRKIIVIIIQGVFIFGTLAFFANELSADEVYKTIMIWIGTGSSVLSIPTGEK